MITLEECEILLDESERVVSKNYKKISPPFGYFGSKNRLAFQLCKNLPPHNCWVEAFCGSAALTLAKPPAKIEVINDLNDEIVNLFRQLRNNSTKLKKSIILTPYAEAELLIARAADVDGCSDLERARIFLVKSMMSINGVFGKERGGFSFSDSYERNGQEARVSRWNNLPERLDKVVDRLKRVRIENKDARKILKRFANRPASLIYLDPPYLGDRTNGYDYDANDVDFHKELLEIAQESKCMIFISGYDNDFYSSSLSEQSGWKKESIETSTKGTQGGRKARTEVVWMNKHFINALDSNLAPITLTAKEAYQKKLNPERD